MPRTGIYANRTLNLHTIRAIGYDMDYTLIHYHVEAWERLAYEYLREGLIAQQWPVADLSFDPGLVGRGLIIDLELGNVVKANRFGYVKRGMHGTRELDFGEQRHLYSRTRIDLREERWVFMNTLFSISEGCMYAQLVDAIDAGALLPGIGYRDLYRRIRRTLDEAHMEGRLKGEILADPASFVELDADVPLALLDQKDAGKQILLITNSEWTYTAPMLSFAFDRFLPGSMTWRDLFDVTIVSARKPSFFEQRNPAYEIVDDQGLLREARGPLRAGAVYAGGNAALVEESLGLLGEEILYVGDHLFVDVNVSKSVLRWRTALILRELEEELAALDAFASTQARLSIAMEEKQGLERELCRLRLMRQHRVRGREVGPADDRPVADYDAEIRAVRSKMALLDERIGPMAKAASEIANPRWGLLMLAGNDKSHLARQVERYADVYASRVSAFRDCTPFAYLRSPRGTLPHTL